MKIETPRVLVIPGLYWNLPGIGGHNRQANNNETVGALQAALGELAVVELHDANFHDDGTPKEKEDALDLHVIDVADQTGKPVLLAGASLGGNMAFGAALRLGPNLVSRGLAVCAPLRVKKSPPPGLRLRDHGDIDLVESARARLEEARPEDLARLAMVHGANDFFVKPAWSQWKGIDTYAVPGFWHPHIIKRILSDRVLMRTTLLEPIE